MHSHSLHVYDFEHMLSVRTGLAQRDVQRLVETGGHLVREPICPVGRIRFAAVVVRHIQVGKDAVHMRTGFCTVGICAKNADNRNLANGE